MSHRGKEGDEEREQEKTHHGDSNRREERIRLDIVNEVILHIRKDLTLQDVHGRLGQGTQERRWNTRREGNEVYCR